MGGSRCRPTILMYHSVGRNAAHFNVTPEAFRAQMAFLKERGFEVVTLDECVRRAMAGETGKIVALTFDDGYADFPKEAWPVLKLYGYPAVVFLITGLMGGGYTTSTGVTIPLMTWDVAEFLKKEGVSFGSHTVTHAELDTLAGEDVAKQLVESRVDLREHLDVEARWLCYPRGKESPAVRESARSAGYVGAVTVKAGHPAPDTDTYGLPRAYVHSEMGMKEFEALFV